MKKESDLDGVKAIAKALLMTDICTTPYSPVIVQHPFTSTGFVVIPTEKHTGFQPIDITLNDENLKKWQDSMRRIIEKAENPYHVYMLLNPPYALTFLNLLNDQYSSTNELICDIKVMNEQLGQVKMSFFCPLDGNIEDSEYGGTTPVNNLYLKSYEWDIRELLEMEQSSPEDEMAQFFNDDDNIKDKLVTAVWTVDEYKGKLYGRIDCRFKEELTEDETEVFKDWLTGQCSDGFGEHIEQQPIDTEDGDLFVSFWHPGDSYFLCTEDELDNYIEGSQGMQLGGM